MMPPPKRSPSQVKLLHFREDPHAYAVSRKHWQRLFTSIAKKRPDLAWKEWLKDPFLEGRPIFSQVSENIGRGVAINQVLPSDDSLAFRAWMSVFGSQEYGDEIVTLNISCMRIDEVDEWVKGLLREFIIGERPYSFMEELCAEFTHASMEVPPVA